MQVTGKDGNPVGRISKQWTGLIKESLTDTDNFGINFPMDLDVRMKAVLLGACFLIVRYDIKHPFIHQYIPITFFIRPFIHFILLFLCVVPQDFMFFEATGDSGQRCSVFG